MIGASLPAAASPVAAVAAADHGPAAGHDDSTGASRSAGETTTANASSKQAQAGNPATPVNPATRRDAIADRNASDDAQSPGDFAELLAANGAVDASAGTANGSAAPGSTTTEPTTTETAAATTLPEQLLALLSGQWAIPATPTDAATAASAPNGSTGSRALPTAATAQSPGLPLAIATATTAAADATGNSSAALATLAAEVLGAASPAADKPGTQVVDAVAAVDGLALVGTSPLAPPTRAGMPVPMAPLAMPADPEAGFDDGFGTRIAWMAEQRIGHAEIRLNPEHVGPIDVRVQLDGNRVTAEFHSAHVEVRRAIEASVPQLREMLGQHGLQLGHADVGRRHAQGQAAGGGPADLAGDRDGEDGIAPTRSIGLLRSRGLLDEYA